MTFLRRVRDKNLDSTSARRISKCLEFIKTFMIPKVRALGRCFITSHSEESALPRGCNESLLFSARYTPGTPDDEWVKITKFRN